MKIFLILIFTAIPFTALWANTADCNYAAVIFGDNNPETIATGHLDAATFKKTFATDYPVAGSRAEIPKGSTPFGALFLYSDTLILTMPFYHFREGIDIYKCEAPSFGKAPAFWVDAKSQESFVLTIKRKLTALEARSTK